MNDTLVIKLPCKIGTVLYAAEAWRPNSPISYVVAGVYQGQIDFDSTEIEVSDELYLSLYSQGLITRMPASAIGKTLFYSPDEALQHLAHQSHQLGQDII